MQLENVEISSIERNYEITRKDLLKDKILKNSAWIVPIVLPILPAIVISLSGFLTSNPVLIFLSLFWLVGGFIFGLISSGALLIYRQRWLSRIREKLAVDGIKTEEVQWFMHELTSTERKSLKELEREDRLLGDAYRETLASRLTSSRIVKSAKSELLLVKRRENKLKSLKSQTSSELQIVLKDDREKLEEIKREAEQMKVEAETRLQLIEAAARRGTSFADTELALKKLSSRSAELPLALEALKMQDEIRKEIEAISDEKIIEMPESKSE